ncbi:hypothetical protein [Polluticoccus soli]|uniref:hypothetical protein n=1 Tax=Polluticoccus soli TaxID=3034150 RepID=UPI0023E1BF63|nr:hypothetical protein [Flavipsychrobacter sp. JY13-12]
MTSEQIDYLRALENDDLYWDSFEQTLSISRDHWGINLVIRLNIPNEADLEEIELDEIQDLVQSDQIKAATIKEILITDSATSFGSEDLAFIQEIFVTATSFTITETCAAGKLYALLRDYFQENRKVPYFILTDPVDSGFCPTAHIKLYEVHFDPSQLEHASQFYNKVATNTPTSILRGAYLPLTQDKYFYDRYFARFNDVPILQTNAKTRRLGYLRLLVKEFEISNYFPTDYFAKRIEKDIEKTNADLVSYKALGGDDKGIIKNTSRGTSAKPYLELLQHLNIVTVLNRSYVLTKQSKVYSTLLKARTDDFTNQFKLELVDKLCLFKFLYSSDSMYINALLSVVAICGQGVTVQTIKQHFKEYLLQELQRLLGGHLANNTIKRKVLELRKRIDSWEKPEVYLGHIIEPRLNWLLDLGLVSTNTRGRYNDYSLTDSGKKLLEVSQGIYEITGANLINVDYTFEHQYISMFCYIYSVSATVKEDVDDLLESYIDKAFVLFKTEAPNRVTASQAFEYASFSLLLNDNLIVEQISIKDKIAKNVINKYALDWFSSENDGSLSKKVR